jgi:hypothetical protein
MGKNFLIKILSFLFLFWAFVSCSTAPEDTLVLDSILPPVAEVVVEKPKDAPLPVIPLYVQGRVMEIEVVQGVQEYLYIMFNEEIIPGPLPEGEWNVSEEELIDMPASYTLSTGMKGEIYSDTQFTEKAGDFVLLEQYGSIYKAHIEGLNYIIDRTSLVQVPIR